MQPMKSKDKKINYWWNAGKYFIVSMLFATIIEGVLQLIPLYILPNIQMNQGIVFPPFLGTIFLILFPAGLILSIYLAVKVTKKFFKSVDKKKIILIATGYYGILNMLFLIRDVLITDINGTPITRNYPESIFSDIISLLLFYFFSLEFMNGYPVLKSMLMKLLKLYKKYLAPWLP